MKAGQPRRLPGDDATIAGLAALAHAVIAANGTMTDLLSSTSQLARARATHVARADGGAARSNRPSPTVTTGQPRLWGWIVGLGMTASVVSAAVMYPPLRRIRLDPELAVPLMLTASVVAVVALAPAALIRPPARSAAATAVSVIVVVAMAIAVGYRVVVGTSGGTRYSEAQLQLWFVFAAVQLALLAVIAVRSRRATARGEAAVGVTWRGDPEWRRETARLRDYATDLARTRPSSPEVAADLTRRWESGLADAAGLPAEVLSEARAIGPIEWLVWAAYDGEIDVDHGARRP